MRRSVRGGLDQGKGHRIGPRTLVADIRAILRTPSDHHRLVIVPMVVQVVATVMSDMPTQPLKSKSAGGLANKGSMSQYVPGPHTEAHSGTSGA